MFRLISLLIVVLIMGVMFALMADSMSGSNCKGGADVVPAEVANGAQSLLSGCR